MKAMANKIGLTILMYVLDIIVWGSVIGLIYVLGHFTSNVLFDTNYDLTESYVKGIVVYWVFDTILAKFRESYRMVIEYENDKK